MKDIKSFKFKDTYSFDRFLAAWGYKCSDINGYSLGGTEQYEGNVLKVYIIYFNDGTYKYFSVLYLKNLNEYNQVSSGSNINKTSMGYDIASIVKYKYSSRYIIAKS